MTVALSSVTTPLTPAELKFMLVLLPYPHYRAPIAQLKPQAKMTPAARDRICQQLVQRDFVACENRVTRFGLTARGRTLLNLDIAVWPVTPDEKFVLRSCQECSITPGQISKRVPKDQRQILIEGLAAQGLVRITQRQLGDVWLTLVGQQYLREDCMPQGNTPVISLTLIGHYLQFMRASNQPDEALASHRRESA